MTDLILNISTLGAHSNFKGQGFKQKDLRFLAELFTNWVDVFLSPEIPSWHNTQALRHLEKLNKKGWAHSQVTGKQKRYTLTRIGLLEIVHSISDNNGYADIRYTLLSYYFIRAYKKRIMSLIEAEGSGFSKAVQMEILHLFDEKQFLLNQINELDQQIKRLEIRVDETNKAFNLALKLNNSGEKVDDIINSISKLHPYELENQKPMGELLKEIDPEQRLWEATEGNRHRADILWQTQLNVLKDHRKHLKSFIS
ncbi:MAG: hypothetical protein HRT44_03390 [Bdellovibrionales bacterium]|nr:hypothetical protein [Bdellovibrionales bacterium]NQZ18291.1 hypothetical protein [Bdellovibrionales bacterium]